MGTKHEYTIFKGQYKTNVIARLFLIATYLVSVATLFEIMTSTIIPLTAEATTNTEPNFTRMIWTTTRSVTAQRDLANTVLGGGGQDTVVFHYGSGQDPTRAQIDALKQVTRVTDGRKGMEFFSLAEIREHAPTVKASGFGFISYDLEAGASPTAEVSDPLQSIRSAKIIANEHGIGLQVAPSNAISSGQYADDIAYRSGRYHLQSQPKQDDDTTCQIMKNWIDGRVSLFEGVKSGLEGRITFQVTLTSNPAPGKTVYETAKDCIDKVIPGDVDGVSIWWGGAQFDDGTYKQLLKYIEDRYS
ncbi:MAG TPA: hypothetical protein VJ695_11610 [Nitrososphaera sp.]|jgi:hypothetical protein|nr:hypothetical protein [Nitrososphaera sp.]